MKITRRDFIKVSALTAAASLLDTKLDLRAFEFLPETEESRSEGTKVVYTTCDICAMQCAMRAYVKDGVIVKLEGHPDDLQSGGRLCAKGNAGINWIYNPDRLKYPLKRTNPKKGIDEDPGFVRISWEEAFKIIADKLKEIKEKYGAKSILGIHEEIFPIIKALGSPNTVCHHATCQSAALWFQPLILGSILFPDLENARYIISFGWDQAGKSKNAFARNYAEAISRGAKAVVFDPRLSVTASKGVWVPVKPGTDLAVALGMINVIINEKLYDHEFVENYCYGFEELKEFIKPYTPTWASQVSDVPEETIKKVAREFATTKPGVILFFKGPGINKFNGTRLIHAIIILLALTGNIEKRGAMLFPRVLPLARVKPKKELPPPETEERIDGKDKLPEKGKKLGVHGICLTIADSIINEKPYPIKAAIVMRENPIMGYPNQEKMIEAFKKLEFVVDIGYYPDETVWFADIVLPACSYLEKHGLIRRTMYPLYPQVSVRQPVVEPMFDSKEDEEILHELARYLGVEDYLPPHGEEVFDKMLEPVGITYKELCERGVYTQAQEFYPMLSFFTPTKKIELYSTVLEKLGYDPLPYWKEPPYKATKEYPFYLVVSRQAYSRHTRSQNLKWLYMIYPENFCYINSKKAKELGIEDGDEVYVESKYGRIKIKAKLIEGIRPDTVWVPAGWGHFTRGKYGYNLTYGKGGSSNILVPTFTVEDMLKRKEPCPTSPICEALVKVYKAR